MRHSICKNFFKNGKPNTTVQIYTDVWIKVHRTVRTLQRDPVPRQIAVANQLSPLPLHRSLRLKAGKFILAAEQEADKYGKGCNLLPSVRGRSQQEA